MKKTLILASVMVLTMSTVFAAEATVVPAVKLQPAIEGKQPPKPDMKRHNEFEQRLKLSDIQKQKAKEIRIKGHEEMKPIIDQIRAKKKEIETVKLTRIAPQMQDEKIAKLKGEIQELKKQARELRKKNMDEFEAILTRTQKKELEKMKKEGRKRFEENRKNHPEKCKCPMCGKHGFPPPPPGEGPKPPMHPAK